MSDDVVVAAFEAGVDLYWSGGEPEGWRDENGKTRPEAWQNPFLAGWLHSAEWENRMNFYRFDAVTEAMQAERFDELHGVYVEAVKEDEE